MDLYDIIKRFVTQILITIASEIMVIAMAAVANMLLEDASNIVTIIYITGSMFSFITGISYAFLIDVL